MTFVATLRDFGNQLALVEDTGATATYAQLADRAEAFAEKLGATRQLIAIECTNRIDAIAGYLGALLGRHAAILIDATLDDTLRNALLHRYQVNVSLAPDLNNAGAYAMRKLTACAPSLHPDLALLLPTSGSTGSAKLVRLSLSNFHSNATSIAEYLALNSSEQPITTLPMSYSYGLSVINSHLSVGASILLTDQSLMNRGFWQFFRDRAATSFAGVPFTYQMLRKLRFESMELPSLRMLTQAGGRLDAFNVKFFAEQAAARNVKFFVMYGQTEATARIAYLAGEFVAQYPDSIGRAIPGGELGLIDDLGHPIESVDAVGELVYRGPNVMLGYAENVSDLARGDEQHSVLATGDLAKCNAAGFYFVVGRKSRFVKVAGNRVSLDEVESFLNKHGFACAVTGSDDALRIAVTGHVDVSSVEALVSTTYKFHRSLFKIKGVEQLPRNNAGKIQYQALAQEFSDA